MDDGSPLRDENDLRQRSAAACVSEGRGGRQSFSPLVTAGPLAVLADWDGTLAQPMGGAPRHERLAAQFERVGLKFSSYQVLEALHSLGLPPARSQAEIINLYVELLIALDAPGDPWWLAERTYQALPDLPFEPFADALPALDALHLLGHPLGILSNTSANHHHKIHRLARGRVHPDHIVISEAVGLEKPDPAIFRLAAARLGVFPADCVMVGNDLELDVLAAVQAGFQVAFWLDRRGQGAHEPLPRRVTRITGLDELPRLVQALGWAVRVAPGERLCLAAQDGASVAGGPPSALSHPLADDQVGHVLARLDLEDWPAVDLEALVRSVRQPWG